MSVYNGRAYLAQAMDSILGQSLADLELIVIDDGSTDGSLEIIRSFEDQRIRLLVNQGNLGLTPSLNLGLAAARAGYVARQDADDISLPLRLARQAEYLDRHPGVAAVAGSAEYLDQDRGTVRADGRYLSPGAVRWSLLFGNELPHGAMMFRRRVVEEAGGYDETFTFSQDYDLWSRLSRKGEIVRLAEVLIRYRLHDRALSGRNRPDQDRFRDRVSRANMERLLGRPVSPELVRALRTRADRPGSCLEAGRLVADLWRAFQSREALSPPEKKAVRGQAARVLRGLAGLYCRTLPLEAGAVLLRSWRLGLAAG